MRETIREAPAVLCRWQLEREAAGGAGQGMG